MEDLTRSDSTKISSLFPIGSVIVLDRSKSACVGLVIGHIYNKLEQDGVQSPLNKDDIGNRLLVLQGKQKYVATVTLNKEGNYDVWISDIDIFYEQDWTSDDWILKT